MSDEGVSFQLNLDFPTATVLALLDQHKTQNEIAISDRKSYLEALAAGLSDKVGFILDYSDADVYVDFGCADGKMLGYLKQIYPNCDYIGYDICPEMISTASADPANAGITFTTDWDEVQARLAKLQADGKKNRADVVLCIA